MWQLIVLAVISAGQTGSIVDGVAYGPPQTLTCEWFTNFENSRFSQCKSPAGKSLPLGDGASIKCLGQVCNQLDSEARKASDVREDGLASGVFVVRLVGRLSVHAHPKRYIGDGTRTVLVEKLLSVRKSK